VLQHRVVQNYDAGTGERALVNFTMQSIVADVIECHVTFGRRDLHGSAASEER